MNEQTNTGQMTVKTVFSDEYHADEVIVLADALDVLHRHRCNAAVPEELRHACYQAIGSVQGQIREMLDSLVDAVGMRFWAEVFGGNGSSCDFCNGGWCIASLDDDFSTPDCGWAYPVPNGPCAGKYVCWRTRALEHNYHNCFSDMSRGLDSKGFAYRPHDAQIRQCTCSECGGRRLDYAQAGK